MNRGGLRVAPSTEENDMVKVKIIGQAVTQYGTHRTGDILNVSAEFARHLVEEAQAAEYVTAPAKEKAEPEPEPKPSSKARK